MWKSRHWATALVDLDAGALDNTLGDVKPGILLNTLPDILLGQTTG